MSESLQDTPVYLFGTCLIDVFYPGAGMATVALLERFGHTVHFPQGQTCCGQPAFNSGYREDALAVASHQIAQFVEDWPVVVPSGSCAAMLRHDLPALFAGHALEPRAQALAGRIHELGEFLLAKPASVFTDHGPPVTVVVHDSCSVRRALGASGNSLKLLARLAGVTAIEPARAWECCGFGGTFAVKQAALSATMTEDKCQALSDTGAEILLSGDCGCLMNLNGRLEKTERSLRGEHLASFLLRRMTGSASP